MTSDYVVLKGQTCFGKDNTSLLDSLRYCNENGLHAVGIATVDASVTREELQRLKDAGVVGVRFAALPHLVDVKNLPAFKENVLAVVDKIKEFGFVTNLYFEAEHIEALKDMILEVSKKTPVTLDHMCRVNPNHPDGINQPEFQALLQLIREGNGNIYVLLSGPDRATKSLDPGEWEKLRLYKMELVRQFPNLVTVGTDFNHPNSDWGVPDDGKLWSWCRKDMSLLQWYQASYANPMKLFFNKKVPEFDPNVHGKPKAREAGSKAPGAPAATPKVA